jgi:8-amino-7-oxononanoate synthase
MDDREAWIEGVLEDLRARGLERSLRLQPAAGGKFLAGDGREVLNFSSNDYLDLARRPEVVARAAAALREHGAGATASRLVAGTLPVHEELERRIAAWKDRPAALVFGSGYLTSAGAIPAVVGRGDLVCADRLAHASLLDGAVLSRADIRRFAHNDAGSLDSMLRDAPAAARKLVVTESVFSMDGDVAPLREIAAAASRHGALLLVDEAHATGVFGPRGSGVGRAEGLADEISLSMGTLSKAFGGYGGFIACSEAMRDLLVNRARAFIYTTAPPPAAIGAALGALDVIEAEPGLGEKLLARAARFRERLRGAGLDTLGSASQIVPVLAGENEKALALAARIREAGILAVAIRPPTVPAGTARLRLSVTLAHSEEDLDRAAGAVIAAARAEGIP